MIVIASLAQLIDWGRQSDSMDLDKLTTRSSDSDSDSDRLTLLAGKTSFIVVVVVSTLYSINILLFLIFFLTSCIHQSCILYLRSCMHSMTV